MSEQNTQMARRTKPTTAIVGSRQGLKALLNDPAMIQAIKDVLPKHLTPERVGKMVLIAASRQQKLFECTQESFCKAIITASELGLDCSGTLGSGYLVPYWNGRIGFHEAQFMPGYRGLIDLARRSGQISNIQAHVVYKQDEFEYSLGTDSKLVHRPYMGADRDESADAIVCAYAVAELTDGVRQIEVMTKSQIEGIRKRSKSGDSGPWKTDYAEMARKTVVRRIVKYLPLSAELEKALKIDDAATGLIDAQHRPGPSAPAGQVADHLLERLSAPASAPEPAGDETEIVFEPDEADAPAGEPADSTAPTATEWPLSELSKLADGEICSTRGRVKTAKNDMGGKDKKTPVVRAILYDGPKTVEVSAWGEMPDWLVQGSEVYVRALERKGKFFNVLEWEPVIA